MGPATLFETSEGDQIEVDKFIAMAVEIAVGKLINYNMFL